MDCVGSGCSILWTLRDQGGERRTQIKKGGEMERDWNRRVRDRDRHTERMTWPERQKKNETKRQKENIARSEQTLKVRKNKVKERSECMVPQRGSAGWRCHGCGGGVALRGIWSLRFCHRIENGGGV